VLEAAVISFQRDLRLGMIQERPRGGRFMTTLRQRMVEELRPLRFRDPARLVMVYEHFQGGELSYHPVAPADFYTPLRYFIKHNFIRMFDEAVFRRLTFPPPQTPLTRRLLVYFHSAALRK
jgi:hypothetical protein